MSSEVTAAEPTTEDSASQSPLSHQPQTGYKELEESTGNCHAKDCQPNSVYIPLPTGYTQPVPAASTELSSSNLQFTL